MPSVRAAMMSICLSRERMFMTGPVRMLRTETRPLEKQLQLLYICQNGHCLGSSPGLVIGDRRRSNGVGPTVWFGASDSDRHRHRGKRGVLPLDEPRELEADCGPLRFLSRDQRSGPSFCPRPLCSASAPGAPTLLVALSRRTERLWSL